MRYGSFVKKTRSKEYICNFVKNYLELRKQHKMILYMGSWDVKIIMQQNDLSLLSNIGLKSYKRLKISILKLYII